MQPSYCNGQFVSDMQHLDTCCSTSLVYLQEVNTSREERGDFSFSKTEFPLVHQSGPCSGVIYIGEEEEPSHLLDTRTIEPNTDQVATPADSPAPSDPNTDQVTGSSTPADSPAPSDPRDLPPTLSCADELASDGGSLASDKGLSDETHVRDSHDAPGENETLSSGQRA